MVTNDTRIAILGGRGMLGTDLAKICRQQGFDVKVFDLPEFDITNSQQLKEAVGDADAIINCAAYIFNILNHKVNWFRFYQARLWMLLSIFA